jgi:hypothetical protein
MPNLYSARSLLITLGLGVLTLLASAGASASEDSHEGFHRNFLAVFAGITDEDRRERAATLGIEYERRLSERFGIGALVEHAYGDLDFTIYAIPFAWHTGHWKWYVAPGIENSDHHSGNEFLLRLGVEYAFEVGAYELLPQFDVDFVDGEEVLVLGLTFGRGF